MDFCCVLGTTLSLYYVVEGKCEHREERERREGDEREQRELQAARQARGDGTRAAGRGERRHGGMHGELRCEENHVSMCETAYFNPPPPPIRGGDAALFFRKLFT